MNPSRPIRLKRAAVVNVTLGPGKDDCLRNSESATFAPSRKQTISLWTYIAEFNRKFAVPAAQPGTAFVPVTHLNLDRIFSVHHQRVVANDNTIQFGNRILQVPSTRFRATLAGCRVTVYEHLNSTLSIGYGPHTVAHFHAQGETTDRSPEKAVESAAAVEIRKKRGLPQAAWKAKNAFHTSHSLGGGSNKRANPKP